MDRRVGSACLQSPLQDLPSSFSAVKEGGTFDGLCPRRPAELSRRMKSPKFTRLQRRRVQTEGRIGILKHGFLGQPMRAKGADHRELALAWGVLTHNLWMLVRMRKTKRDPARSQKRRSGLQGPLTERKTEQVSPKTGT